MKFFVLSLTYRGADTGYLGDICWWVDPMVVPNKEIICWFVFGCWMKDSSVLVSHLSEGPSRFEIHYCWFRMM